MTAPDPRFDRTVIGREVVTAPTAAPPTTPEAAPVTPPSLSTGPRGLPVIDWQLTGHPGLAPHPVPTTTPTDHAPLPRADVVVITWTSAEWDALHYVFTNSLAPLPQDPDDNDAWRARWHPYRRDFYTVFTDLWSRRLISAARNTAQGAPALRASNLRWGSYTLASVGNRTVLLFKSELHLNQDGERLPLVQMVRQIIEDTQPMLLLSIGTAGGVADDQALGDVMVTNAAKFRLGQEFESAAFNTREYRSAWQPPTALFEAADRLLVGVPEFPVTPPTAHYPAESRLVPEFRQPRIVRTDKPILTTDFFEFGTTENRLDREGCVVEMDDAVLAMELEGIRERGGPDVSYAFVRNVSDPVINGDLPRQLQTAWAVVTYQRQGLLTSYNGAIASWALIASDAVEVASDGQ
ncbi:MAG: hypothetical protein M3460_15880 [Actinomycetota bacterium]|nr:hypothetical protein [Actinomycetota bacterium]